MKLARRWVMFRERSSLVGLEDEVLLEKGEEFWQSRLISLARKKCSGILENSNINLVKRIAVCDSIHWGVSEIPGSGADMRALDLAIHESGDIERVLTVSSASGTSYWTEKLDEHGRLVGSLKPSIDPPRVRTPYLWSMEAMTSLVEFGIGSDLYLCSNEPAPNGTVMRMNGEIISSIDYKKEGFSFVDAACRSIELTNLAKRLIKDQKIQIRYSHELDMSIITTARGASYPVDSAADLSLFLSWS